MSWHGFRQSGGQCWNSTMEPATPFLKPSCFISFFYVPVDGTYCGSETKTTRNHVGWEGTSHNTLAVIQVMPIGIVPKNLVFFYFLLALF